MNNSVKAVIIGVGFVFFASVLFLIVKTSYAPAEIPNRTVPSPTPYYKAEDINQDGTVDAVDENYINTHMGCANGSQCWNKVIGKTLSGDNPIYTSDMDLNHNNTIDQGDLDMIKSAEKR